MSDEKVAEETYRHHQYCARCRKCETELWADTKLGRLGNQVSHWIRNPSHWPRAAGEVRFNAE